MIKTFRLEELLGTKARALYQRKKGRDLFDLHYVILHGNPDGDLVMRCFAKYIQFSAGYIPTLNMIDENMAAKLAMPEFVGDTESYLRDGIAFDPIASWPTVREKLFEKIVNVDLK